LPTTLSKSELLTTLKAASDDTRLRLLVLLAQTEHNVKDLTQILKQSQPRLSRHLKLLTNAGLIERFQEGSWVYYRANQHGKNAALISKIINQANLDDPQFQKDKKQALKVQEKRALEAQSYFKTHAKDWDHIRSLYVKEETVEQEMKNLLGNKSKELLLDLGTGTGRILELFANQFKTSIGIDINHEMLRHARARLDRLNLKSCQLRHGDITNLPFKDASADTIIMHQILHFFANPKEAFKEAARLLKPGGKLLISDFAPHTQEQLRTDFAHQRLGFEENQIWSWIKSAGLKSLDFKLLPNTNAPNSTKTKNKTPFNQSTLDKNTLNVSLWLAGK